MNVVNVLGYSVSNSGLQADANTAIDFINQGQKSKYMACANPHSLVEAESDVSFKESLHKADILLPDGAGILLAAKILNLDIQERVAGTEFFIELTRLCNQQTNVNVFFLGSTEEVLANLVVQIKKNFPNVNVCGTYSPPFKSEFSEQDNQVMVDAINSAHTNVLWVGMTAPKQEKWIHLNRDKLNVNFIGAIGAVFDFYSGSKKRAPQWICKLGLEWLPRLLREPGRLWKRNFVSSPLFLIAVFKQRLGFCKTSYL
ncbi:MAG: WecB/TagA/CpsF family glycosyltransferase [Bacteroidetes bacterium]|nr:WecB/TagA/CpsF family glycosyltransferase [Bacteroidota bacterium]